MANLHSPWMEGVPRRQIKHTWELCPNQRLDLMLKTMWGREDVPVQGVLLEEAGHWRLPLRVHLVPPLSSAAGCHGEQSPFSATHVHYLDISLA